LVHARDLNRVLTSALIQEMMTIYADAPQIWYWSQMVEPALVGIRSWFISVNILLINL